MSAAASRERRHAPAVGRRFWHYRHVRRSLRPWLLTVPLAALGVVAGHEIAYALTNTADEELHGYMSHLPQVALLVTLLSLLGAAFVERGSRLALWPFPAVAMAGFVAQEHIERLAHSGSVPFLLDKPFFLVGLVVQAVVAIAAWLLARLLIRIVGAAQSERNRAVDDAVDLPLPVLTVPVCGTLPGARRPRAPPLDR